MASQSGTTRIRMKRQEDGEAKDGAMREAEHTAHSPQKVSAQELGSNVKQVFLI